MRRAKTTGTEKMYWLSVFPLGLVLWSSVFAQGNHLQGNICGETDDGIHRYFDISRNGCDINQNPDTGQCCATCTTCLYRPVDFVFAVDGSSSISSQQWVNTKLFIYQIVNSTLEDHFNRDFRSFQPVTIGLGTLRIGLVVFGTSSNIVFDLEDYYQQKADLLNAILAAPKPGGGTVTHRALNDVTAVFESAPDLGIARNRVMVLITDGLATSIPVYLQAAVSTIDSIPGQPVTRLAIAVLSAITNPIQQEALVNQLLTIVSQPDGVQTAASYDPAQLDLVVTWLSNSFCVEPSCPDNMHEGTVCTTTTDRVCVLNGECNPVTQYEVAPPTTTTDILCADASIGCPSIGQYISQPVTATADRLCSLCPPDTWQPTTNGDACQNHTVCVPSGDRQQYETVAPTVTTNRVCRGIRSCSRLQYISVPATPTTDVECQLISSGCPITGQYISQQASTSSDRVCDYCEYGTFQSSRNGRNCTEWHDCIDGLEYETVAPTITSDRACVDLTDCNTGPVAPTQYIATNETATSDRICANISNGCPRSGMEITTPSSAYNDHVCTDCDVGFFAADSSGAPCIEHGEVCDFSNSYESVSPTPTTDRICSTLSVCNRGTYASILPTTTTDRICVDALVGCPSAGQRVAVAGTLISNQQCEPCPLGTFNPSRYYVNDCQAHTECLEGEFEIIQPTSTSDRKCLELTSCKVTEYVASPPTPTSDRICAVAQCPTGMYISGITSTSFECAECSTGTFSPNNNSLVGSCREYSTCIRGSTFEWESPTSTSDRVCVETQTCTDDESVSSFATLEGNRICDEISTTWQDLMIATIVMALVAIWCWACCICLCLRWRKRESIEVTGNTELYSAVEVRKMIAFAIANFEAAHGLPTDSCGIDDVLKSPRGLDGWVAPTTNITETKFDEADVVVPITDKTKGVDPDLNGFVNNDAFDVYGESHEKAAKILADAEVLPENEA